MKLQAGAQIIQFTDYVYSFYGAFDAVYPMRCKITGLKLTKDDVREAIKLYINFLSLDTGSYWTWGDGDSLDRERIRHILETCFTFQEVR